jgi:two-component sensor histidine kinase
LKYAFPEAARRVGASGEICIKLLRAAGDRFVLTVSDNGIGLPEGFDIQNCKSLGIKLVSALTRQLDGSIHIDTGAGTEFAIIFARPRRRGNAANA